MKNINRAIWGNSQVLGVKLSFLKVCGLICLLLALEENQSWITIEIMGLKWKLFGFTNSEDLNQKWPNCTRNEKWGIKRQK